MMIKKNLNLAYEDEKPAEVRQKLKKLSTANGGPNGITTTASRAVHTESSVSLENKALARNQSNNLGTDRRRNK